MPCRRRLEDRIAELEKTIIDYMLEKQTGQVRIGGYQVSREDGEVTIYELPPVDVDQLKLPFSFGNGLSKLHLTLSYLIAF